MAGFNFWNKIAAALKPAASEVVRDEVFFCADAIRYHIEAQGLVSQPREGYPGGFMLSSVYAATTSESTYGNAIEPPGDAYLLPEETPADDQQGVVGVAANYAIFVNDGHHTRSGSYVSARPFFEPGMEQGRAQFDIYMATMEARIKARL